MKFMKVLKSRSGWPIDFRQMEDKIDRLARRLKISLIYIFGSYAHDRANRLSDLAMAYLSRDKDKYDPERKITFLNQLQNIFEEEAVDPIDLRTAALSLIHQTFKEGRCIYAVNLKTRIEFETRTESLYFDTKPLRDDFMRRLVRGIKNASFGHR